MEAKKELRREALERRNGLTEAQRHEKDAAICNRFCGSAVYRTHQILLLYASFGSEVDTWGIMARAWAEGRQIYLPRVEKAGGLEINFYFIHDKTDLKPGYQGILEPVEGSARWDFSQAADTLLVYPGVAFDTMCRRIGYGGGFYDRFSARCRERGVRLDSIALCYEVQLLERVCEEEFDARPMGILTEARTI